MRILIALLVLAFSFPVVAQEKKAEKKTEKKAVKKLDGKKADAKKADAKKADKKPAVKKTEKTTAKQEPKQDWGRFQSQSKKDEADRQRAAAAQKK